MNFVIFFSASSMNRSCFRKIQLSAPLFFFFFFTLVPLQVQMKPRATALVCHFVIFFFLSQPSAGNHFNISFLLETPARCQLRSRGPKCDAAVNNQSLIKKKKRGERMSLIARLMVVVVRCMVGSRPSLMSCLSSMTRGRGGGGFFFFNFKNIPFFLLLLSRKRGTPAGRGAACTPPCWRDKT